MGKYSFIINVGNAIDRSHFRMYFLESISKKKLSMYDIDDLSELRSKIEYASKHIDRNMFEADKNDLIVCVSRTWDSPDSLLWWTLFLKSYVNSAVDPVIRRKINHIYLFIVDNADNKANIEKKIRDGYDDELLKRGYLSSVSYKDILPIITEDGLTGLCKEYISADEANRSESFNKFISDIPSENYREHLIKSLEIYKKHIANKEDESDDFSFLRIFDEGYKAFYDRLNNSIDACIVNVSESDLASKRISHLQLVTFLVKLVNSDTENKGAKELFSKYCNSFDANAEAYRLDAYMTKMRECSKSFGRKKEKQGSIYTCDHIQKLAPIRENELIGSDGDIDRSFEVFTNIKDADDWDKKFERLLEEIASYETRLNDYGKSLSRLFQTKKAEQNKDTREFSLDKEEEAKEKAENELKAASDKAYQQKNKGNNTYVAKVEITNQFTVVGNCIKRIQNTKKTAPRSDVMLLTAFSIATILIPYCVMQSYIFSGIIKGNFIPLVCGLLLILIVILAKPVAAFLMERSLNQELQKLKKMVQRYFEDIQERQKLFHDNIDSMIDIWNAEQRFSACESAIEGRASERMRKEYHHNVMKNNLNMLSYFSSFIENYYPDDGGYSIRSYKKTPDLEKGATNNEVYWIEMIEKTN